MSGLAAALMVAIRVHAGQVDKQGQPYLLHIARVVEAVSVEAKVVAALHDVWEDGGLHVLEAEGLHNYDLAGLSLGEQRALELLTRQEGVEYHDYIQRIVDGENTHPEGRRLAREVKLADLRDNLGRMPEVPNLNETGTGSHPTRDKWASLRRRYEKAITTLESASVGRWGTAGQR